MGKWVTFILQNINVSTLGVLGLDVFFEKTRRRAETAKRLRTDNGAVVQWCGVQIVFFEFFIHSCHCQRQQRPQALIENLASINPHNC